LVSGIDGLRNTMAGVLDEIHLQTGLIGLAIFAGPEPEQGGNITTFE